MQFPVHLLLPLASSVGYVAAVLFLKRSADYGVGLWRTTFVANWTMGICFIPLWMLGGPGQPLTMLWQPATVGATFLAGQICTFWALKGDVSVATPVLGLKLVVVAFLSAVLLAEGVPLKAWIAAGLCTLAIALLNSQGRSVRGRTGVTVIAAALAATAFAFTDVLVQKWAPAWGVGRFLPGMAWSVALLSLVLIPWFSASVRTIPLRAWGWLGPGSVLLAFQAAGIAYTLGIFGDATSVNIVYSSRGLWSVLAVFWIGHWFRNEEQHLARAVLYRRLVGALLMIAAISMVLT